MNEDSLNASFWVMILMQTLGSVDPMPGMGPRKMPSPKAYITTIFAWGGLQVASDAGYEDGAAKFGWLMVLAALVLGPFGKRVISLLKWVSMTYGNIGTLSANSTTTANSPASNASGNPTTGAV
jgi:hypothetical protein